MGEKSPRQGRHRYVPVLPPIARYHGSTSPHDPPCSGGAALARVSVGLPSNFSLHAKRPQISRRSPPRVFSGEQLTAGERKKPRETAAVTQIALPHLLPTGPLGVAWPPPRNRCHAAGRSNGNPVLFPAAGCSGSSLLWRRCSMSSA